MELFDLKDKKPDDTRDVIVFQERYHRGERAYYDAVGRHFVFSVGYSRDKTLWMEMPKLNELICFDVNKRIPENTRDVLIYRPSREQAQLGYYSHIIKCFISNIGHIRNATHWSELPTIVEVTK